MADEVTELEDHMNDLVHDMRAVCVLAARQRKEAEAMASVLQVIGAIEAWLRGGRHHPDRDPPARHPP